MRATGLMCSSGMERRALLGGGFDGGAGCPLELACGVRSHQVGIFTLTTSLASRAGSAGPAGAEVAAEGTVAGYAVDVPN
jgi:hypothetical protein